METKEVEKFQKRLNALKKEILTVIAGEENPSGSRESMDEIDQATEMIEQEMGSLMSSNIRTNLVKVEEALKRIENGQYGKCLECGKDIAMKRLRALPFAIYCVPCQQELEDDY